METSGGSESSGGEDAEARRLRRGHVLAELMQTERVYVQELGSILHVSTTRVEHIRRHGGPRCHSTIYSILYATLH